MRHYTIKMAASFEDVVTQIIAALNQRGFRVIRSFDLAGTLDPNDPACSCPHHGTERCTCRYTVLLVYRSAQEAEAADFAPHTITIHTRDGEAYIGLARLEPGTEPQSEEKDQEVMLFQVLLATSVSLLR